MGRKSRVFLAQGARTDIASRDNRASRLELVIGSIGFRGDDLGLSHLAASSAVLGQLVLYVCFGLDGRSLRVFIHSGDVRCGLEHARSARDTAGMDRRARLTNMRA